MQKWVVIYKYPGTTVIKPKTSLPWARGLGFVLLALSLGGLIGPFIPAARLEAAYALSQVFPTPTPVPAPPVQEQEVKSTEFTLSIPKIGVNSPVIPNVDPTSPDTYSAALLQGVAHASTSFLPGEDGTVYLFSHSTNYDWFVKDLNAVFYLLKNLETGDTIEIKYHGKLYTYIIRKKKIVSPKDISYLVPTVGSKSLILETCWPPGSVSERLLVFADLTK